MIFPVFSAGSPSALSDRAQDSKVCGVGGANRRVHMRMLVHEARSPEKPQAIFRLQYHFLASRNLCFNISLRMSGLGRAKFVPLLIGRLDADVIACCDWSNCADVIVHTRI